MLSIWSKPPRAATLGGFFLLILVLCDGFAFVSGLFANNRRIPVI